MPQAGSNKPGQGSNKPGQGSNKPGYGNVGSKGTGAKPSEAKKPKVFYVDKDIFEEILAKERDISPWSAIILPVFVVLLLGAGIACVVVGVVKDIPDLIVLGAMLLVGAVVFGLMMFVTVCRPFCSRNQVSTFEDNKPTHAYKPAPTSQFTDYFYGQDLDEDLTQVQNKPSPTDNQLYGNARSELSTPATTTRVHFESEPDSIYRSPPPPSLSMPSGTGMNEPVYNLDIDNASKTRKEMAELELL